MADIALEGVSKAFGPTSVLEGIDLAVPSGAFAVILGPSGCGKSTLLRLIAGLEDPSGGRIAIGGRSVAGLEPRERGCAMVFQNYALYPHMSVAENIAYGLRVEGRPRRERRARAGEVAALVGLEGHLDRKPAALSGGQRQRVAMARAIVREPAVFLFDEPLSNLDAELRVRMRHEVRRIHAAVGATSVFVTHDQVEAMTMADLLVVMRDGRIEQTGPPKAVYDAPATAFVAGFLGAPPMNLLPGWIAPGGRSVVLDGGATLPLRAAAPEGRVTVGLRPEALRIGDARDGEAVLRARHAFMEELGATRLHHLELAGAAIVVSSASAPPEGPDVSVVVPRDAAQLFAAPGGGRLALEPTDSHASALRDVS